MKKISIIIMALLIAPAANVLAQISEGGMPRSYSEAHFKSAQIIPTKTFDAIDIEQLMKEDESNGTPYRYGIVQDVDIDLKAGLETTVDEGTIWRYEIASDNAKSIKLLFDHFTIPEGAELFIYNQSYAKVFGAYTSASAPAGSPFAISDFPGNSLIIEYYEPSDAPFEGSLHIDRVSLAYRNLDELLAKESSNDSYIDVNCAEGKAWQLEKHAVCLYSFTENSQSYICSGALINNTANDGTPYFLTANHCISSPTVAETVTAYFNYETKGCGMDEKSYKTLSGATLLTTGANSDFTLLRFASTPPPSYQPYYAGWELTDSASSTVCIHHPAGLLKKIAFDKNPASTYPYKIYWDGGVSSPASTHWMVYFDEGATAGGSSGSPLFNQNRRIIGQLHGGGDYDNYYGKLNYSWDHSSSTSSATPGRATTYPKLSTFLADSSNITALDGYTPATNKPEAVFSTDYQYVCVGSPIPFTDYSLFGITKWQWSFTPSTVTFANGTTAGSQNPVVIFDQAGTYNVKLSVNNSVGSDSVTYYSAIVAGSVIDVTFDGNVESGSCYYDLDTLVVSARGAFAYNWQLNDESKAYFNLSQRDSSHIAILQKPGYYIDSTFTISGIITGTQGTCTDTTRFSYQLLLPHNDNIENAQLIETGESGPYTNICAGIEEGEPVPPIESCTTQTDWCDEYGTGEDIIEHSVWFCFYGPESGAVSIEANDMDGQIALYSASSYLNILNGTYTLLAANDDISSFDANSKIKATSVTPGKLYWLQFDGSGGGSTGEFSLVLTEESKQDTTTVTAYSLNTQNSLSLYPQPASNYLIVKDDAFANTDKLTVKIFTMTGSLMYVNEFSGEQNSILLDLGSNIPDGIYILSVTGNNVMASGKFVKVRN